MSALTVIMEDTTTGRLRIVDDHGAKVGEGRAFVSETHPGYVTVALQFPPGFRFGAPLRVPIDWTLVEVLTSQ